MTTERITKKQALRAVLAKLPIRGDKALQESLEFYAGSMAEAYRLGVQEAQACIAARVEAIKAKDGAE